VSSTRKYQGIVLLKNKGMIIPEPFVKIALANNPNVFSAAWIDPDGLSIVKDGEVSVQDIMDGQEQAKDRAVLLHLAKIEGDFDEDEIQPHVLLRGENDIPLLIGFGAGDYSKHEGDGSAPPVFNALNNYVMPKLLMLQRFTNGKLDKILDELRSPTFSQDFGGMFNGDGLFTMLAATGEVMSHGRGIKTFPWGWASNAYSYAENTQPAVAEPAKKGIFGKKSGSVPQVASTEPVKQQQPAPTPAAEPKKADLKSTTAVISTPKYVQCPVHITRNQDKRAWYMANAGWLPGNWKDHPKVEVKVKSLKDLAKVVGNGTAPQPAPVEEPEAQPGYKDMETGEPVQADPPAAAPQKDTAAKHVSQAGPIQVLPAETKSKMETFFLSEEVAKVLDASSKAIYSEEQLAEMEKKFPNVTDQIGLPGITSTLNWPIELYQTIAKEEPQVAALFMHQMRNELRRLTKSQVKATPTETKDTSQVQSAQTATKKSIFGKKAAAA